MSLTNQIQWVVKQICWLSGLLLSFNSVFAQSSIPVTSLGIEQGLSTNTVRTIFQDARGFMWFGTSDGLSRYDGYGFKTYRKKIGLDNSLIHNIILSIAEDKLHRLWIGTRQGLSRLNDLTGQFTTIKYQRNTGDAVQELKDVIRDVKADGSNNIFIATEGTGLLQCEQANDQAKYIPLAGQELNKERYGVHAISIDKNNKVWVLVQNRGLGLYDPVKHCLKLVLNDIGAAGCLFADGENVWIGTPNIIYKYSVKDTKAQIVLNGSVNNEVRVTPVSMFLDNSRHLWMGTFDAGVMIFDINTGTIEYIKSGDNKESIGEGAIYTIYEDASMRKWIGTARGGVSIIDPQKNRFKNVSHQSGNKNSLSGNVISAFYEDTDSTVWIGTDGSGINEWDRQKNEFKVFAHDNENEAIPDNYITAITSDGGHFIWISSFTKGVIRFDKLNQSFKHYACENPQSKKENKVIFRLYLDSRKNLWATALRQAGVYGGLYRFNREADRFEAFDLNLSDLFTFIEDRNGKLWGGDLNQLILIDTIQHRHKFYPIGYAVRAIHDDRFGNLWIGTEGGGLLLFDRNKGVITARYTTQEGLSNNVVLNILEDSTGKLWMSTYNGLSKLDVKSGKFTNYDEGDGLESKQFYYSAALQLRNGEMVFGSIKGFTIFNPEHIAQIQRMPNLLLTGIRLNNTDINENSHVINKISRDKIESLKVPYDLAILGFDYTALEYSSPGKISYAYYMEGWDRKWNAAGNTRTATYTHISEGTYTFRVRCTNAEGIWNPDELAVQVIILPPWYRTWWAYTVYAVFALALVYAYSKYKAKQRLLAYQASVAKITADRERLEREKKQAELDKVHAELEKDKAEHAKELAEKETQKIKLEKESEINEKRNTFFTNISHEFRTPLTLIINPVKNLLKRNILNPDADQQELDMVHRNAKRMLSLVDQLLLFRRTENGASVIKPTRLNFCTLCHDVYVCFVQQAKAKNITYTFQCDNPDLELYADREKIEIVFYNLVSNAIKYTASGGNIIFSIMEEASSVLVKVADTGTGIDNSAGDKLFEKFFQDFSNGKPKPGFGIGLYLVKQFTEEHKGDVSYKSKVGEGTVFTVSLLKGTSHLDAVENEPELQASFLQELANEDLPDLLQTDPNKFEAPALKDLTSSKPSILIADDDIQMRQYLAGLFKSYFTIYEAPNGTDGLSMAQSKIPDIIISDINMDEGDGLTFCKAVKSNASLSHIPVILLTAASSSELKLDGVESGADDYITKPFEQELLLARVNNLLKSRSNLQKYFYNEITLNKNDLRISAEYKEFLDKCIAIVEANLDNERFTVKDLAQEIGMSHSSVYKKIKEISGQSLNGFIRFVRMRKAAELFINTSGNIGQIAYKVGINDKTHFREHFTKVFGIPPADYIKKYRKPFNQQYNLDKSSFNQKNGGD